MEKASTSSLVFDPSDTADFVKKIRQQAKASGPTVVFSLLGGDIDKLNEQFGMHWREPTPQPAAHIDPLPFGQPAPDGHEIRDQQKRHDREREAESQFNSAILMAIPKHVESMLTMRLNCQHFIVKLLS